MITKKLAGCIITDSDSRILLIHRNTSRLQQWELPGGKVEPGESLEQAAIRETLEEIDLRVGSLIKVGQTEFDDNSIHWHYTWFKAADVKGTPSLLEPDTFDDLKFFDLSRPESINAKLSPNIVAMVEALKNKTLKLSNCI